MQTRSLDSARFMSVPAPTLMFTGLSSRPRRLRQHRAPDGDAATGEHEGYRGAHVSVGRIRTEPAANAAEALEERPMWANVARVLKEQRRCLRYWRSMGELF